MLNSAGDSQSLLRILNYSRIPQRRTLSQTISLPPRWEAAGMA
jgi:hypothetical protein